MSLVDELTAMPTEEPPAQRRMAHPRGWEPGVKYDPEDMSTRIIVTPPVPAITATGEEAEGLYADLIATMGQSVPAGYRIRLAEAKYDPAAWTREVQGDDALTAAVWRYRFVVELIPPNVDLAAGRSEDLAAMIKQIIRQKPPKPRKAVDAAPEAFAVVIGDWQLGKADGDGTEGIVGRIMSAIGAVEDRVAELRRQGRNLTELYVFGVGDIIENCDGHYAQQAFQVQLGLTEQIRLARILITKALQRWSLLFDRVVVPVVQGNHGEVRKGGKSFTSNADNFDTDVFKAAAEVLEANEATYGHVSFVFPQSQDQTLTVDVLGTVVGLAHGHQYSLKSVGSWLARQSLGRTGIGDCDILITGHYHHFLCQPLGSRLHLQCPTMDSGSDYWEALTGEGTTPGMLTLVIGANARWRDLAIL